MGRVLVRSLDEPDDVIRYPSGQNEVVHLGGIVVTRDVHQPGWRWDEHVKPIVGTETCQFQHRGVVLRGRMGIRTDEGETVIIGPDQVYDVEPGHVGWVEGDEELVTINWAGGADWAAAADEGERTLATVLFTDMVDSTKMAREVGDAAWRHRLSLHDQTVRTVVANYRGRVIDTAGDSYLVLFDGAARAVRCGLALVAASEAIGMPIRVGMHTGEVTMRADHVQGLAVNAAARVLAIAGRGEVLVSATTRELSEGSELAFTTRGRHALKGLDGDRELFVARTDRA
jgi:class 3 adenylate cyclase